MEELEKRYILLNEGDLMRPEDEFWDEDLKGWFLCNADKGATIPPQSLGNVYRRLLV